MGVPSLQSNASGNGSSKSQKSNETCKEGQHKVDMTVISNVAGPFGIWRAVLVCVAAWCGGYWMGVRHADVPGDSLHIAEHAATPAAVYVDPYSGHPHPFDYRTHHFWPEEIEHFFGVREVHELVVPDTLKEAVDDWDVYRDWELASQRELYENYARVIGPTLDYPLRNDRRFIVKYISPEKLFGVVAATYIPHGAIIAEYTGQLTNSSRSTDYEWHYPSTLIPDPSFESGNNKQPTTKQPVQTLRLGIDAQLLGNVARFVNHDENPNCDMVFVPWRNHWRAVYISVKDIWPGDEVTASYGVRYWETRNKHKA